MTARTLHFESDVRRVIGRCAWLLAAVLTACGNGATVDENAACTSSATVADCPHHTSTLSVGVLQRNVYWKAPAFDAPDAGYPAVIDFQGSYIGAATMWHGAQGDAFGMYYQTQVIRSLVEAGFVVLTPEAKVAGATFWDTNVPPFSTNWESSADHEFMKAIFAGLTEQRFGPIDTTRLYATGLSSGAYMTSRMAVSYAGRFRALAVCSGSYATCAGPLCEVPAAMPSDHPPTLFMHGQKHEIVPIATMLTYRDALANAGIETATVTDAERGHEWLPQAPATIAGFFTTH